MTTNENGGRRSFLHPAPRTPVTSWWRRLLALGVAKDSGAADLVFPPGFLESLDRLRILALKAAGGGLKEGHRLGAYKGGQLEFHDHRSYAPGDDLRYLDWNLYARLGKPFVKEFAREEAGAIHLLLDATPSMALGTPSKWTFARRVAALFAHVGWSARDQVRAYVFRGAGADLASYPPRAAKGTTPDFIAWLRTQQTALPIGLEERPDETSRNTAPARAGEGAGALGAAVRGFLRRTPAHGRVFVLSDFWQEEPELTGALRRLSASGFDLAAIQVLAPEELAPPDPGELRVLSLEEAGEVEVSVTPATLARYAQELETQRALVEGLVRRRGGLSLMVSSATPLERVLLQTLRRRRWIG